MADLEQLTDEEIRDLVLLSVGTTFAVQEQAIEAWSDVAWDEEELTVLRTLSEGVRMRTSARLVELAEKGREALRDLDGAILVLTGRQDSEAAG